MGTAEEKRKGDKDAMPAMNSGKFIDLFRGCKLTQPQIDEF